jgi:hypothetical protein
MEILYLSEFANTPKYADFVANIQHINVNSQISETLFILQFRFS